MKRFIAKLKYVYSGNSFVIRYRLVLGRTTASAEKKLLKTIRSNLHSVEVLNFEDADNIWHKLLCRKRALTDEIATLHAKLKEASSELDDIERQLAAWDKEPIA